MDRFQKLEQIIETNFRLNAISSRELGSELRRRLEQQSLDFRNDMEKVTRRVEVGFAGTASLLEDGMNAQAERLEAAVEAIRHLGDSSVDVNKEIADLKRRVKELEDRAAS